MLYSKRTYTIVAPKVLRPSLDYHVSISLHGNAGVTNLVVAIDGFQDGGGPVRNSQSATVDSNSTQVIKFQVRCYYFALCCRVVVTQHFWNFVILDW